jgi:hypothetical protein
LLLFQGGAQRRKSRLKLREEGSSVKKNFLLFIGRGFCLPGYVIIILSTLIFVLVYNKSYFFLLLNKVSYCNCFRVFVPPMYCKVCVMGETLLGKVRNSDTELVKWSGAPEGLSEVRWTRTTVGGPNDLGGSVTHTSKDMKRHHIPPQATYDAHCIGTVGPYDRDETSMQRMMDALCMTNQHKSTPFNMC